MPAFPQMTVLARSKSGASLRRRHPDERPGRAAEPPQPAPGAGPADATTVASDPPAATAAIVVRRRHQATAPQDQALYTCDCGFVFEAQVSTSVGCPHCGGAQAW